MRQGVLKAINHECLEEVLSQYLELQTDCQGLEFSSMGLWEAMNIFSAAKQCCNEIRPALFEGDSGCPSVVIHFRPTGRRLDVELSSDGTRYTSVVYQDLSGILDYGPMDADSFWLDGILAKLVSREPDRCDESSDENHQQDPKKKPLTLAA